jgi:hypothetical protein
LNRFFYWLMAPTIWCAVAAFIAWLVNESGWKVEEEGREVTAATRIRIVAELAATVSGRSVTGDFHHRPLDPIHTIGPLHRHKPGTEAGRWACSEQRSFCCPSPPPTLSLQEKSSRKFLLLWQSSLRPFLGRMPRNYLIRDRIDSTAPSSRADCAHGHSGQADCTSLALA